MLDTVKINHVQHISFTQSRLTDAVSVILRELLSYEHPSNCRGFLCFAIGGVEGREASVYKEECGHAGGLVMQTKLTNQMVVNIIINTRCWREGG